MTPEPQKTAFISPLQAQSYGNMWELYRKLFSDQGKIESLQNSSDDSIAVQSVWQSDISYTKRAIPLPNHSEWTLSAPKTDHFLKVLGLRLEFDPPTWWRLALRNADVFPESDDICPSPRTMGMDLPSLRVEVHSRGLRYEFIVDRGGRLQDNTEYLIKTVGTESDRPDQIFNPTHGHRCVITKNDTGSYIALFFDSGWSYRIWKLDPTLSQVVWSSVVLGSGAPNAHGSRAHSCSFVVDKSRVFVFGADVYGAYIEGFEAKSGKAVFRFCTRYGR